MAYALRSTFPTTSWDATGSTFTTRTASGSSALSVGDLIVVVVPYRIVGGTSITVTDSLGNTYTETTTNPQYELVADSGKSARFFYCSVTNAGTPTITATAGSACRDFGVFACAYSGMATSSQLQVTAAYNRQAGVGTGTDAMTSNSATIVAPPCLVIGWGFNISNSNGTRDNAGTGFTSRLTGQSSNGLTDICRFEDKRATVSGATTATWTATQAGDDQVTCILCFSELNTDPTIQGGTANPVHLSTGNTITGVSFGASQGAGTLVIGGQAQTVTAWSDTSITYTANRGVNLDDVAVNAVVTNNAGTPSGAYALTGFHQPSGYYFVTLTSVNATASYRITAAGDIAAGNQLEWDNSLVTIYADGSFVADPTVTSFNVRAGVTTDGWGSLAAQTLASAGAALSSVVWMS